MTGVQTCALPIFAAHASPNRKLDERAAEFVPKASALQQHELPVSGLTISGCAAFQKNGQKVVLHGFYKLQSYQSCRKAVWLLALTTHARVRPRPGPWISTPPDYKCL